MRKFITKLLLFLILFLAITLIIHTYDTYDDIEVVGDKFNYFAQHKDEYNTIFIGSSAFYRQIVPALFDQVLHAGGFRMKSFNFGAPGMHPPESYFITKRILALNPQKLEWVILELDDYHTHIDGSNLHARKSVYWHDVEHTMAVTGAILKSTSSTDEKITDLYNNLMLFCKNLSNAGRGPAILQSFLRSYEPDEATQAAIGLYRDGYMPLENEQSPAFVKRREAFIESKDDYREKVASVLSGSEIRHDFLSDQINYFAIKELVATVDHIKRHDARPLFVLPPRLFNTKKLLHLHKKGIVPDLISFEDPATFPQLYDVDGRFDEYHLNHRTAQEFTKLFADKVMALISVRLNNGH